MALDKNQQKQPSRGVPRKWCSKNLQKNTGGEGR